ncbi:m-AAA protease-interacting protein 1, mitochondrial-like [Coregonus clupeaformis]|uniref:m-AAA protease-interacting protein 1, mitochondrial-like n=1 Tax=Coregonus clupeaformis TaxID=59861 RepID=UPI001BDF9116|nr:m-AAA protease-interacting protein 1, mitochondrial-like [Coregonus clupeaformis]
MALPMLRGCNCSRLPSVLSRFLKPEHVVLPRPNKTTRLAPTLSVGVVSTVRAYSSDRGGGRKFASILMRYWYLTSARLPEESLEGTRIFQVAIGGEGEPETKRLLTANYEFQREFTRGVSPDWTITRIEHSKLLD